MWNGLNPRFLRKSRRLPLFIVLSLAGSMTLLGGPANAVAASSSDRGGVNNQSSPPQVAAMASTPRPSTLGDLASTPRSGQPPAEPPAQGKNTTETMPIESAPTRGARPVKPPDGRTMPDTSIGVSFDALSNYGIAPSDSNGAVGPNDLVETVNEEWAVYSRTTGTPLTQSASFQDWYGTPASVPVYDPHVIFDPFGNQYVMSSAEGGLNDTSYEAIRLSVSEGSSGTGYWCKFDLADNSSAIWPVGDWIDYPQVGMSDTFVIVSFDVFDTNNKFVGSRIIDILRSSIESAAINCGSGTTFTYQWWGKQNLTDPDTGVEVCGPTIPYCYNTNVDDQLSFAIAPSMSYEEGTPAYLIDTYTGGGCAFTLWTLSGNSYSNTTLTDTQVPSGCYSPPPLAAQAGSTLPIDSGDTRAQQVTNFNGRVSFALTTGYNWGGSCGTNAAVYYAFVDPSNASTTYSEAIGYQCDDYYYPALQPLGNGAYVITYSYSSTAADPSLEVLGFTSNHATESNLDVATGVGPDTTDVQTGFCGGVTCVRWGDYNSARLDPADVSQAWVVGDFSDNSSWYSTTAQVGA